MCGIGPAPSGRDDTGLPSEELREKEISRVLSGWSSSYKGVNGVAGDAGELPGEGHGNVLNDPEGAEAILQVRVATLSE